MADNPNFQIAPEIQEALRAGKPVVALESTVITHGLPYPENLQLAQDMEAQVRAGQALPATIAVIEGQVHVGINHQQMQFLAEAQEIHKISGRDFAPAIAQRWTGGTTVAATLVAAERAGIRVFATGGIGGVHRDAPTDISADLPQLAKTPVVVVCAGAKSILDLPATLEYLETFSVPVIGYQSDEFPAFYARSSGLSVSARADTPEQIVAIARAHWRLGFSSAILVANPPPAAKALQTDAVETVIRQALAEAKEQSIRGQAVTPFLLRRVSQLTHGESLQANLSLLLNNASLAARIAGAFAATA